MIIPLYIGLLTAAMIVLWVVANKMEGGNDGDDT